MPHCYAHVNEVYGCLLVFTCTQEAQSYEPTKFINFVLAIKFYITNACFRSMVPTTKH